jgi:ankyrin repeat protein
MLVDIRSGQAETENTDRAKQWLNRIKDDHQFSFHKRNLQQWLEQRTQELCKIKRFQDNIQKEMKKIPNPDNGKGNAAVANNSIKPENVLFFPDIMRLQNQMVSDSSIQFGFEISFLTLLESSDSFLEQMKQQTHEISNGDVKHSLAILNGIQNRPEGEKNNDEPNNHLNWYNDGATLHRIETAIDIFVALIKENANNVGGDESFALALTVITDEEETLETKVIPRLFIYTKDGIKLNGSKALLYLCQHYRRDRRMLLDVLRLWLGQQAYIATSKNTNGWNALLLLCRHYSNDNLDEMVQLLADKGIDINWTNKDVWNALHLACKYYQNRKLFDIFRLYIDQKIEVHCKTSEGDDALHLVCQHYNKTNLLQIVGLLLLANNGGWHWH